MSLPFWQVDAFADAPFGGNPAAVMPLERWLADELLQAIAAENNLSETAFTVPLPPGAGADHELRWFTPEVEVALCGHATLAAGHVLMGEGGRVRFRTRRAGDLAVLAGGDGLSLDLPAWMPSPRPLPELAAAMGGDVRETWWREGGYALFLYPDEDAVRALRPDLAALRAAGNLLYIATAPGTTADVVSRVFAPGAGIDEDPVTGSAHALLTPFWADRLGRADFTAFQASARGGRIGCALSGDRAVLTGRCRTVIEGRFFL